MNTKERQLSAVEAEIARERAESLANGARRLRVSLDSLRSFDAGTELGKDRAQLLATASEACLCYLVQREVMGLGARDAEAIRTDFDVPPDVWNNMGSLR